MVQSQGPEGPCGIVQLSRFEKDPDDDSRFFWLYFSKKAVTNPRGKLLLGMQCSDLDETEYKYDWRSREIYAQCDYIKFGLF